MNRSLTRYRSLHAPLAFIDDCVVRYSRLPGFWDSTRKMLFALGGSKQSQSLIRDRALSSEEELVVGNVLTRGAHVMEGYWGRPDKTREALHADGWLDTGDVGWMDEAGRLWLLGRQKDVIKSGGENVYASEVSPVYLTIFLLYLTPHQEKDLEDADAGRVNGKVYLCLKARRKRSDVTCEAHMTAA